MIEVERFTVTLSPDVSWSDQRLAAAAKAGERTAFRLLYERHRLPVFRYLVRWLGDRALAEDVLQDAFLQVYEHLDRYDGERPFRGWLYGVVRNVAQNTRRKRKLVADDARERAESDSGVLAKLSRTERQQQLRAAFAALPDDARALLLQRHRAGLKLDELAEAWGCTDRTIRNRLYAASDQLVQALVSLRQEGP